MNRVRLYFARLEIEKNCSQINNTLFEQWLSELSLQKQAAVERLINDKDRLSSLLGLHLLKRCVRDEEIPDFQLSDIHYPESGKPYWNSEGVHNLDFNISHSEDLILVAMSKTVKVGVDIEKRRILKNLNFKMVMSPEELDLIRRKPKLFFNLWSRKEAVVKAADTAGIARMRDVILENEQAMLDDVCWHIKTIDKMMNMETKYSAHLATSQPVDELIIKQMSLDDFLN